MKIQFSSAEIQKIKAYNDHYKSDISKGWKPKVVYANPKQLKILKNTVPDQTIIGGRGSSKSYTVKFSVISRWLALPGAKFFLAAPTFKQMMGMTLSGLESTLNDVGMVENRDYVKWKEPPKHFLPPISKPEGKDWRHIISYRNGSHTQCLSMDVPDANRGPSFAGGDADEIQNIKRYAFDDILYPAQRGYYPYFPNHPMLGVIRKYGSMPRRSDAQYHFENETKSQYEPNLFSWSEMTAYDNIQFWGEAGIERLRKTMSPRSFDVEVMNMRIKAANTPFYPQFKPDRHVMTYHYDYVYNESGWIVKGLKVLQRDNNIAFSFDFGGWFNCNTVWQYSAKEHKERCLAELYLDGANTLLQLVRMCREWMDKQGHRNRTVHIYGEPRGHDPRPDGKTLYQTLQEYFAGQMIMAIIKVKPNSQADEHIIRKQFINELFSGTNPNLPTIEISSECIYYSETLETTDTLSDGKKDKAHEKDREYPQHRATHLTDTGDYYMMKWYNIDGADGSASAAGTI